jgi:bacillithiol system protein YtxJ
MDGLDEAIAGSASRPLLLFKHSLSCGTSAHAHQEVEAFLSGPSLRLDARVVHVQTARAIAGAIADRFGIRHESPQLLLLFGGQVVWHASHYRITRREMTAAVERQLASVMADATSARTP